MLTTFSVQAGVGVVFTCGCLLHCRRMFLAACIMNFVGSQELCSVSFDLISTSLDMLALDMLALDILVLDILGTSC